MPPRKRREPPSRAKVKAAAPTTATATARSNSGSSSRRGAATQPATKAPPRRRAAAKSAAAAPPARATPTEQLKATATSSPPRTAVEAEEQPSDTGLTSSEAPAAAAAVVTPATHHVVVTTAPINGDDVDEGEYTFLFGSDADVAGGGDEGGEGCTTLELRCSTPPPPPTRDGVEHSPEMLTADSESKRSCHRWQQQLLAAASTPATQRLSHEELPEAVAAPGDGDGSAVSASDTAKRLFAAPARCISLDSVNLIPRSGSESRGSAASATAGPPPSSPSSSIQDITPAPRAGGSSSSRDGKPPPALPDVAARNGTAPHTPAAAGRLRMGGGGGSSSRPRSPSASASASPYTWLQRAVGWGVGGLGHRSQQQLQQPSSSSVPSPALSPLSRLADEEVDAEVDGVGGGTAAATPQRPPLREPPVWRSPRVSQLPKSLNVSPASVGGAATLAKSSEDVFPSRPSSPPPPANSAAAGRPSTQLITRAAATRPTASPGTMWICIDDDDDEDEEETMMGSGALSATVAERSEAEATSELRGGGGTMTAAAAAAASGRATSRPSSHGGAEESGDPAQRCAAPRTPSPAQPHRRSPAEASDPIASILSPTFRHRRGQNNEAAAAAAPSRSAPHCFIHLDDDTEDDDDEAPPRRRARDGTPACAHTSPESLHEPPRTHPLPGDHGGGGGVAAPPAPLWIIDDDDDEEEDDTPEVDSAAPTRRPHRCEEGEEEQQQQQPAHSPTLSSSGAAGADDDGGALTSPVGAHVRNILFPKRLDPQQRPTSPLYQSIHAYQQHWRQERLQAGARARDADADAEPDSTAALEPHSRRRADASAAATTAAVAAATRVVKRGRATDNSDAEPALADRGRPADVLLRDYFPAATAFTKKAFMAAARTVLSPRHFLEPGDFWAAFRAIEFVGEGSFGLVWRCRTVDGDLVAVKSCPLLLRTRANVEDSFSTIREIATMRFLNEMQVPYVLPLHSAFYVSAREALPPCAQEALEWRRQLRKTAEAAALEVEVQQLSRGGQRRLPNARVEETAGAPPPPLSFEQRVAAEMARLAAAEGPAELATRARLEAVRLPRLLSITQDDLNRSDATAFLVMELCDGDVEGIPRSDGIAKGVAYCVSSALAAMHELGLLHIDLKPSNVLFAYEHGPSQQQQQQQQQQHQHQQQPGTAVGAIKFYLSDFGNCRLVGPDPLAEVPDAYGTYEYMDVRALRDAVCGRPTDAFSLGATLYELLYGKRLYPKCTNPRCAAEEDHTRDCFVEAASRPVVLPAATPLPAIAGPTAASVDVVAAAAEEPRGPRRPGKRAAKGSSSNNNSVSSTSGNSNSNSNSISSAALPPLQHLTLALLRQDWSERMTAEECRRYLVRAFHITQAEAPVP